MDIPSVDAAVSTVPVSAASVDVLEVLPPTTGALGTESVVVAALVVD